MAPSEEQSSGLEERLRTDVRGAQRDRDQVRVDTLRLALNSFHTEEVARTDPKHGQHRRPLTEQDRIVILEKQIRQREEAATLYQQAGRSELYEKEQREAGILRAYVPAPLTDAELRTVVQSLIAEHGNDFRKVMPLASRQTKGRADGRRVQEIVRELTTS